MAILTAPKRTKLQPNIMQNT